MESSSSICLPGSLDRERRLEHWIMDAGRGRELVDDFAYALAGAGALVETFGSLPVVQLKAA